MKFFKRKPKAERAAEEAADSRERALLLARLAYTKAPNLFSRYKIHLAEQWLLHGSLNAEDTVDLIDRFFLNEAGLIREHDENLFQYVARCCSMTLAEVEKEFV